MSFLRNLLHKSLWTLAAVAWMFLFVAMGYLLWAPASKSVTSKKDSKTYQTWKKKAVQRSSKTVLSSLPVKILPELNALLNGLTGTFLLIGLLSLVCSAYEYHKYAMGVAAFLSVLFFSFYLLLHYYQGSTPFPMAGSVRTLYFTILLTHSILAASLPFLVPIQLYYSYKQQWKKHRNLGKWVLPIWLYVSPTGVIIYFMLYQLPRLH